MKTQLEVGCYHLGRPGTLAEHAIPTIPSEDGPTSLDYYEERDRWEAEGRARQARSVAARRRRQRAQGATA